ncbi:hypothetical protein KEM48_000584 [Puccinia striiformis f. sp. tritici PST-130]|nr:hypothetical protein KEM48_000584 [Puccinia striiformis f. sp. tritici PST-130]
MLLLLFFENTDLAEITASQYSPEHSVTQAPSPQLAFTAVAESPIRRGQRAGYEVRRPGDMHIYFAYPGHHLSSEPGISADRPDTHSSTMDSLDSLNHLDEQFFDAGHQLGVRDGREAGKLEGFQLGEKEGFKLWEELAYYLGQAQIWGATQDNTGKLNAKIQTLISLIEAFPTQNPPESDGAEFLSQLNNIRASYRMCCANLGIRPRIREAAGNSL